MQKRILILCAIAVLPFTINAQVKPQAKTQVKPQAKPQAKPKSTVTPKTETKPLLTNGNDSLSYAIGMNVGANLRMQGVDKINSTAFIQAMNDALAGKTLLLDDNAANMTIQEKLQEFMNKKVGVEKEKGRLFLENNKKQPGITELPNGIQYAIIKQGDGIKPRVEDTIKVHYRGTTIDGEIFDESYKRGEPIEFPLGNLIEGWKQTLVLMPVGSKWKIFLPSDYGYGDYGQGAKIPGGATLIFELELLDVKPVSSN